LKEEIKFSAGKGLFRRQLKKISFKIKKSANKRSFLIERNDVVARRASYRKIMKKNDELGSKKKRVVFLDKHGFTRRIPLASVAKTVTQSVFLPRQRPATTTTK
jgi:hypothetical protein